MDKNGLFALKFQDIKPIETKVKVASPIKSRKKSAPILSDYMILSHSCPFSHIV